MASPAAAAGLRRRKEEEEEEEGEGTTASAPPHQPARLSPFSTAQPSGLLSRAWAAYTAQLEAHPLRTRALTAGTLACAADVVAQALAPAGQRPRRGGPLTGWRRSAAWAAWGALVSGPAGHAWQGVLDSVWPPPAKAKAAQQQPATSATAVVAARVAADAALFSPAINALALAFIALVIERAAPRSAPAAVRSRFWTTQKSAWMLWPAASAVAYAAVPPRLRVLFFNSVGFFWTLCLATRGGGGGSGSGSGAGGGAGKKAAVA